jgi:amino acid transporter
MADARPWRIPRIVASVFFGIILSGILMAMLMPALGVVPYWAPWLVAAVCIAGVQWGLGRVNRG